eukprot:GFKZ01004223.1.p3 GENE.GFKZ01004223.1~~GFKZ01004223.1.p3  ORF type:complete len:120 (-),score=1.76 GFKZ01004223.1:886-1245(-)
MDVLPALRLAAVIGICSGDSGGRISLCGVCPGTGRGLFSDRCGGGRYVADGVGVLRASMDVRAAVTSVGGARTLNGGLCKTGFASSRPWERKLYTGRKAGWQVRRSACTQCVGGEVVGD